MSCDCPSPETCGCYFAATADIVASGTGSTSNPLTLRFADGKLPWVVCTSDDRPPSPVTGQPIYEVNTGVARVWDGTRWRLLSPAKAILPGPIVGGAVSGTAVQDQTVPLCSGTVTHVEDPFTLDLVGQLTFLGLFGGNFDPGIWDVDILVDGNRADRTRIVTPGTFVWLSAKTIALGFPAVSGATVSMEMTLRSTGTAPYTVYADNAAGSPISGGSLNRVTPTIRPYSG